MSNIGAIILGAGMSKRMGTPKLLLPLNGKHLFRYPLEVAIRQHLHPILFIGGEHIDIFQKLAADLQAIEFIRNPNYMKGMSTSLKLGIEKMGDQVNAALIFLADQPFVPDLVVQTILDHYKIGQPNGIRIVRPQYQGNPGHPILVHKSLFSEFLKLEGDQGGKEIMMKYRGQSILLPFENSFWGMDIDIIEDYQNSRQYLE